MCDEAMITRWAKEGLSRRQFGTLGGIAVLAACNPGEGMADNGNSAPLTETTVSFATPDGTMDGFFVHPASGAHPSVRSEEHTSELQSLMRNSYAVFCLKKKKKK